MAEDKLIQGLKLKMCGSRTEGAYIKLTLAMMKQFGIEVIKNDKEIYISSNPEYKLGSYEVEPDLSGVCYFYAMSALLGIILIICYYLLVN